MNAPNPSESTPKKKILLVEDSDEIRLLVALHLRKQGYEVAEASEGLEGLAQIETFRPDVIISDIDMSPMNGIEMAQTLRGCSNATPIIFASTIRDESARALEVAKITPFVLHKPALPAKYVEMIEQVLRPAA